MKKALLFCAFALAFGQLSAQKGAWTKVSAEKASGLERVKATEYSQNQQLLQLDETALRQSLSNVADKFSGLPGVEVSFPNVNGATEKFLVWENSNFVPELQAQFPNIRSYAGVGVTDKAASINFSVSPLGVQTMVLRGDRSSEFIEAYTKDRSVYVLFDSKTRISGNLPFVCSTPDVALSQELGQAAETNRSNSGVFKTMRLALSCTGEYGVYFGGTVAGALAAMNATMTRCNGVFEKDLALHLNMIANTTIIYTNPTTDPYSPASGMANWNTQLQNNLTSVVGDANYDIGHLFGASGGGGNAGCIGCVCNAGKGSGITSPADNVPMGDNFDIDYVAHEMGHQLGGNHTFTFSTENNTVNVEPGSGSTIMAYAGITGATDVQAHSDPYFTYRSILQIQTNLATKTCPVTTPLTNQTPVVNAGADWTIPKGTAFILTGTGSDPDGTPITFCWEENDDANVSSDPATAEAASYPSGTKTNGPNFRSVNPTTEPVRYMPNYATVLGGNVSNQWEAVSTVARTLNFTLTGRDNIAGGGQTQTDAMVVTVSNLAGPFAFTSQNTSGISWTQGSTQTITWSVANTASLVGSANVNLKLSTDNGATWTMLVANTPNDGSETITVPNVAAPYCRLMIEPTGNIYYAVNSTPFAIGYTVTTTCTTYSSTSALTVPDGTGANTPGAVVANAISVPNTGTISDVNVMLNVTHTYPNDLVIGLNHPDGTQDLLWNRSCGGNDNFNVTLSDGAAAFTCGANMTGTFAPYSPLAVYNGKPANGTWTLLAADYYVGDTGTINSWSVEICTQSVQLSTPDMGLADFVVYPNPNNGAFNISFNSNSTQGVKVMVHDMRGRQVYANNYANTSAFNQDIQLNNVQSGVYLLTVTDGERKEVKKIVIN